MGCLAGSGKAKGTTSTPRWQGQAALAGCSDNSGNAWGVGCGGEQKTVGTRQARSLSWCVSSTEDMCLAEGGRGRGKAWAAGSLWKHSGIGASTVNPRDGTPAGSGRELQTGTWKHPSEDRV